MLLINHGFQMISLLQIHNMVKTGLEQIAGNLPEGIKGKRVGILCHAPSILRDFTHITTHFFGRNDCILAAVFGPQHGISGQTQDNMIEWEGSVHPEFGVPVFSLYGEHRKPSPGMLERIDLLIVDLQDVGARLYTYVWTLKLCMEACSEAGIPVWVLDRPNPVGRITIDGPVLKQEYFTFVGGACLPMCHRMTIGEMALWLRSVYYPSCDLHVVWMKDWQRNSLFSETGLPWVLPSPNMPTLNTAIVYPGMVLLEALNLSEGRGTTIPFELFGAPFLKASKLKKILDSSGLKGCSFREHGFIPTFNKFSGILCEGIQVHVTDPGVYRPVETALEIINAVIETSADIIVIIKDPHFEYENRLMPFDILSGDSQMRNVLTGRLSLKHEKERWKEETEVFSREFSRIAVYRE